MMAEIMRQTQNPGHVATTHLGRRFAHLAIERRALFDDQDARFSMFALQHECRSRTGKCAPDDHDVIIEIHRPKRMAFIPLQSKPIGRWTESFASIARTAASISVERPPRCRQD